MCNYFPHSFIFGWDFRISMKKLYILIAIAIWALQGFSQGQANIWYFGNNAGLTFNGGAPVALTNGALNTSEGCATISDKNGNLLFYSDGTYAWDRNHNQMPNGSGMTGNNSSAQSAIIIPKPGSKNLFYIFTVPEVGAAPGVSYSMVDMTLNGGLGDVVVAGKNTLLLSSPTCEKITAVKHANGLYVWVVTHKMNNNEYYAYLVDCNGVNAAVVSAVGQVETYPGWGYLEASPDGHKLGTAMRSSGFELLDFDNTTGMVSNPILVGAAGGNYGISFSGNSNVLYGLRIENPWHGEITQWDLQAGSAAAIIASATTIGTAPGSGSYGGGGMQLGPDGKLYVTQCNQPYLSVINNPDVVGTGCNFQTNAVNLSGRNSVLGLPPFIMSFFDTTAVVSYTNTCEGRSTDFTISTTTTFLDSVHWDFDDPATGTLNFSNSLIPVHTFSAAGAFNVQLIRYIACISDTTYTPVTIVPPARQTQTISICPTGTFILPNGASVSAAGIYNDTLAAANGCDSIIITNLTVTSPSIPVSNDTSICLGSSAQLGASGGLYTYIWTPTTGLNDPNIANPIATPLQTTSYVVASQVPSDELIVNGDFSAGNIGFSSSYTNTTNLYPEATYYVGSNPNNYHSGFSACTDHTSGGGNMMIINGAGTPNISIWCESISVVPNTDYSFSCWAESVASGSPAILQFSINGGLLGTAFNVPSSPCVWQQFYATWNSGSNTTADICIVNQNTATGGNDFAIDDLSFIGLCTTSDTVTVTVNNPTTTIIDTAICDGYTYTFLHGNTSTTAVSDTAVFANVFGCDSIIITNLSVNPSPLTDVYDTICQGFVYTRPSGITANATGTYVDTLFTTLGCDSIITTYLTVNPTSATTVFDTICMGGNYSLPDGTTVTATGVYPVTLANVYGCDSVVTTNLKVIEVALSATPTDVLCNGGHTGSVASMATDGVSPYNYDLSLNGSSVSNNTNGSFSNLTAGSYTVNAIDDFGCEATANVQVKEPLLLVAGGSVEDVTCYGNSDGRITLSANDGTPNYTFRLGTATNASGIFTGLTAGDYAYTVTDAHACIDTGTLTVIEPQPINLTLTPTKATIKLSESVQLTATTNYGATASYMWTPSYGLSCVGCPDPVVMAYNSIEYHLHVSVNVNGNECDADSNVLVTVIPNYDMFIPNSFTPNGDGVNDYFEMFGNMDAVSFIEIKLFNRIGEKVFDSNDIHFKWDGTYKGVALQPGVLVYTLRAVFVDGHSEKVFTGSVSLLK